MNADEYGAALDTLKGKGIQGHWATPFPFTGSMTVQSLLWQFGGELFNADATAVTWADEPGVKAMTWFTDLVKNGHSPGKIAQDADIIALQNGKTAFNWNGIWTINTLKEKTSLKWGVAPLPNIGGTKAAWAGSHQFVLPTQKARDENKQTAARVFLNWVSQQSLEWAKAGQVPARNSVRDSAEFKALKDQATLATQINDLHFPPPVPGIQDAMLEWEKALNESCSGSSPRRRRSRTRLAAPTRSCKPTSRSTSSSPPWPPRSSRPRPARRARPAATSSGTGVCTGPGRRRTCSCCRTWFCS